MTDSDDLRFNLTEHQIEFLISKGVSGPDLQYWIQRGFTLKESEELEILKDET